MKFNKKDDFWKGKLKYLPILAIVFFLSLGGGRAGIQTRQRDLPGNEAARQEEETMWMKVESQSEVESETESQDRVDRTISEMSLTEEGSEGEKVAGSQAGENLILDPVNQENLIYIHVCGCVNKPGVYSFKKGARLQDAIMAAEGFSVDADTEYWNLAESLSDGQQLRIPSREEVQEARSASQAGQGVGMEAEKTEGTQEVSAVSSPAVSIPPTNSETSGMDSQGRVNLNRASQEELKTLNGIGDVKSQAIIAYREEHGAFQSIDEIKNVSGIGKMTYEKIKDSITVN